MEDIEKRNEAIALFMGFKIRHSSGGRKIYHLGDFIEGHPENPYRPDYVEHIPIYDSSWNNLMPVVEKIESQGNTVRIAENTCNINQSGIHEDRESKIESVFIAVSDFCLTSNPPQ